MYLFAERHFYIAVCVFASLLPPHVMPHICNVFLHAPRCGALLQRHLLPHVVPRIFNVAFRPEVCRGVTQVRLASRSFDRAKFLLVQGVGGEYLSDGYPIAWLI